MISTVCISAPPSSDIFVEVHFNFFIDVSGSKVIIYHGSIQTSKQNIWDPYEHQISIAGLTYGTQTGNPTWSPDGITGTQIAPIGIHLGIPSGRHLEAIWAM